MSKQKENLPLLHSQFLESFKIEKWANLPVDEPYLWRYLSYHLVGAGRKEELRNLLLDFNWMQSKLNVMDVHFLISDYAAIPVLAINVCKRRYNIFIFRNHFIYTDFFYSRSVGKVHDYPNFDSYFHR